MFLLGCAVNLCSPAHQKLMGFSGSYQQSAKLSNDYFKLLMGLDWTKTNTSGKVEYTAPASAAAKLLGAPSTKDLEGRNVNMTPSDMVIKQDPQLAAVAKEYAADNDLFIKEFASAWTKAMNADRFDGPVGNVCNNAV